MIVTCPDCEAKFEVPESALGHAGRKVKCSAWGHMWHLEPPGGARPAPQPVPAPPPPPPPAPEPESGNSDKEEAPPLPQGLRRRPMPEPVRRSRDPEQGRGRMLGWGGFALVLLGSLAGLVFGRASVMGVFPASAAAYEAAGLAEPPIADQLEIRMNEDGVALADDGSDTLLIEGVIVNTGRRGTLPPILAELRRGGELLKSWRFEVEIDHPLATGEEYPLNRRLENIGQPDEALVDARLDLYFDLSADPAHAAYAAEAASHPPEPEPAEGAAKEAPDEAGSDADLHETGEMEGGMTGTPPPPEAGHMEEATSPALPPPPAEDTEHHEDSGGHGH
jgi:predicted Zn finger-like uncharacterized protein